MTTSEVSSFWTFLFSISVFKRFSSVFSLESRLTCLLSSSSANSKSSLIYKDLPNDDPKQRRPDITKAKSQLNWEPVIELEDGLTKTIDWISSQL